MLCGTLESERLPSPAAMENEAGGTTDQQSPRIAGTSSPSVLSQGVTPCDVVYREGKMRLLRYRNKSVRFADPILVCFALVNRPYILDLKEGRSVVRRLLDHGFDVYLVDWGVPDDADRYLRLEDYVGRLLTHAVNRVCESSAIGQLNLLGYCMGGTISTIFTTQQPQRVKNLILMATPIDFAGHDGLLNLWAREEYFDVDKLIDAYGNCPGEFLQFVFQLMKPVQNFAEKQLMFSENLNDATFVDNFVAVERWACDSIPVVGETFRQYVKALYQQNQLVKGQMRLAGSAVRLETIRCPLLLLVAEKDHLVVPESTLAIQRYVSSRDVKAMSINAGHVGLAVSSKAHRSLWPEAAAWIADHSTEFPSTA
jgi:polyhydroxyalkanoate synthase